MNYEGKHIRNKQLAVVSLEITDSKLRVRETRVRINNINKSDQKTIELRANQRNCFSNDNSFVLQMNVIYCQYNEILTMVKYLIK